MRRSWLVLLAVLAVALACSQDGEGTKGNGDEVPLVAPGQETDDPEGPGETDGEDASPPSATGSLEPDAGPAPEPCERDGLENDDVVSLTGGTASDISIAVSNRTHRCAPVAVVAAWDDEWSAAIAAPAAAALDAPLLLVGGQARGLVAAQLRSLETEEVVAIGVSGDGLPGPPTEVGAGVDGPMALALEVVEHLGLTQILAIPEADGRARAAALARLDGDRALLPIPDDAGAISELAAMLPPAARLQVLATEPSDVATLSGDLLSVGIDAVAAPQTRAPNGSDTVWLHDPDQGPVTAVAAVAATSRGDALLPIEADDLRRGGPRPLRVRDLDPTRVVLVGDITPDARWQLPLVLDGPQLPGGGFALFEDRRMVAIYGSPRTAALGAMGEQPLEETIPRVREIAEPYGEDGLEVLPAFEVIATVASASPEPTGDYSRRTPIDDIRPWVDRAAEEDIYVILDLQPGRSDFLQQAREYEELLVQPHVGLALDPEWRLGPEEVHLEQIGSVEADEVQAVIDWLASLTRENNLPQKLLVLHQFRFSMLPDRASIRARPELAVVVHMDGQGPLGSKDQTYAEITRGVEDTWLWGWKNFYDEDEPTATPEHVLARRPRPVFVSYQ